MSDLSLPYVFHPKMQHCNKANEGKKNKHLKTYDENAREYCRKYPSNQKI